MERIITLLDKIKDLNQRPNVSLIEVDLMMDYAKVMYADLIEWRNKLAFTESLNSYKKEDTPSPAAAPLPEPAVPITAPPPELHEIPKEAAHETSETPVQQLVMPVFEAPKYVGKDIREMIGINDKYQFISELFGNNKDAYEEVISELNSFEQESEAQLWLQKTIRNQYNWSEDNETLQSFNKLLNSFYAV